MPSQFSHGFIASIFLHSLVTVPVTNLEKHEAQKKRNFIAPQKKSMSWKQINNFGINNKTYMLLVSVKVYEQYNNKMVYAPHTGNRSDAYATSVR